ncbi:hypothetical protein LY78DRAFT_708015 [Colletotrichum sublineola]|nr:hypothetical protein LY78DRAFT_708015 [Colletotrichum sublineola]
MNFSFDHCSQIPNRLQPYGDIAGIGVIIGFVASAWLTIMILVAYYIFAFDPRADPFEGTINGIGKNNKTPYIPNPMDMLVANCTRYLRRGQNHGGGLSESVFHKVSKP